VPASASTRSGGTSTTVSASALAVPVHGASSATVLDDAVGNEQRLEGERHADHVE